MAKAIARSLKADIEEIKDKRNRTGVFGFLKSGYEALFKKLVDIQPINKNPEEYDLVIVGSPVWLVGSHRQQELFWLCMVIKLKMWPSLLRMV